MLYLQLTKRSLVVFVFAALSQTLETTCLMGDIVLHLPDVTHKVRILFNLGEMYSVGYVYVKQ